MEKFARPFTGKRNLFEKEEEKISLNVSFFRCSGPFIQSYPPLCFRGCSVGASIYQVPSKNFNSSRKL